MPFPINPSLVHYYEDCGDDGNVYEDEEQQRNIHKIAKINHPLNL
jgi:hypothetical protein